MFPGVIDKRRVFPELVTNGLLCKPSLKEVVRGAYI